MTWCHTRYLATMTPKDDNPARMPQHLAELAYYADHLHLHARTLLDRLQHGPDNLISPRPASRAVPHSAL